MKSFLDTVDVNNLTSSEQIIYQYFKDHLNNIVYLSLSDICKELYVSNATVIRFSQKLGFKGFNELKFQLKNELNLTNKSTNAWDTIPHRTYCHCRQNGRNVENCSKYSNSFKIHREGYRHSCAN